MINVNNIAAAHDAVVAAHTALAAAKAAADKAEKELAALAPVQPGQVTTGWDGTPVYVERVTIQDADERFGAVKWYYAGKKVTKAGKPHATASHSGYAEVMECVATEVERQREVAQAAANVSNAAVLKRDDAAFDAAADALTDAERLDLDNERMALRKVWHAAGSIVVKRYRDEVESMIKQGEHNANLTVLIEKRATTSEWAGIFRGSVESLLAHGHFPHPIHAFFAKHGIAA